MDLFCKLTARGAVPKYIRACFPAREKDSHKGSFGRAWLICGSSLYTGAALLAAEGCLRMGAGLTYLAAPSEVTAAARLRLPELICRDMPSVTGEPAAYPPLLEEADAALIGPGIGQEGDTAAFADMIAALLSTRGTPLVLDADALFALGQVVELVDGGIPIGGCGVDSQHKVLAGGKSGFFNGKNQVF